MRPPLPNLAIVSTALLLGACAAQPEQLSRAPITSSSVPVASTSNQYAGPLTLEGDVRAVSYGAVRILLEPPGRKQQQLRALHLRLLVSNNSSDNWVLDVRDQRLGLRDYGRSAPAFASASPGTSLPEATVAPSRSCVIDLFFPLPSKLQTTSELPRYAALWWLKLDGEVMVKRIPFAVLRAEPAQYSQHDYGGDHWGPPYWHNLIYEEFAFIGAPELPDELAAHLARVEVERGVRFEALPSAPTQSR